MSNINTEFVLAAPLATSGTVVVGYPPGFQRGHFIGGIGHRLVAGGNLYSAPNDFELTFNANASGITLTWRAASTLAAGTNMKLQLERPGRTAFGPYRWLPGGERALIKTEIVTIDLGSPDAASATAVCASQGIAGAALAIINGGLAVGGVVTFDVPRNVVAAWTNTAIMTVTGTDAYGNVIVESSGSGTSMLGSKAFRTVTSVTVNATVTGATVGSGVRLGLPVYLPGAGHVLRELENGATATAGTLVAGSLARPSATTGDVRGTYAANSAPNGNLNFKLVVALPDPDSLGVAPQLP